MKRKDLKEYHTKDRKELEGLLKESRKQLVVLKMEKATGKGKNVHALSQKKDEIARILTILKEKEIK